jgi:hypothetical protein
MPQKSNVRSESGDESEGVKMSSISVQLSGATGARRTARAGSAGRTHLRLTRRGRVVVTALVTAPLVAAAVWFGLSSGVAVAGDESGPSPALQRVTVAPGESLWQIAVAVAPHDDPRDVVDGLIDMNGLETTVLTPGETLVVPPQYAD